ncbi:MAG: arginine--tRNA ligase [candidate division KSB1 bacterium]|nr:arginine--tRNA ligase [candidate division KSB1 bacterium]MDZ7273262.1 arginine--tRNA ligase [candidate division KSB1 bacterium]MDZ7285364.1 arginine--tRNA ligase [candidate division KSB1 bacterium]MDZ7298396.1 arginine--tRNA ligase [candidate division KSB1 bacterium]MDZ7306474.1 arginine--tRNA ligase [candidate division KSB1 bacterium]
MNRNAENYLEEIIAAALARLGWPATAIVINRPRQEGFGDFATPVAMNLAKILKKPPRALAQELQAALVFDPKIIGRVTVAGPGFLNFHFTPGYWQHVLAAVLQQREAFGRSTWAAGKKVNLEFVSANPTGPLNVVNARAASIGDVLANLLQAVGAEVVREYYINDAGQRVKALGYSISSRYMNLFGIDEPFPEDGYHGEYVRDLAVQLREEFGDRFVPLSLEERSREFTTLGLARIIAAQRRTLAEFRVHYDVWFSEQSLLASRREEEVLRLLHERGASYEKDGALWFRSSQFGDEQDRVLVKKDGEPTYFLGDIAYHMDKFRRDFNQLYDLWGPDHHGHVARMKAALVALGYPAGSFEVRIIQQVNLLRGGELVKMSKRSGNLIEMRELIDEVGVDAARFFFLMRTLDSPMDFDLDLAKKQSDENPVYYVQYAHARVCNILAYAAEQGHPLRSDGDLSRLREPEEIAVLRKLSEFPETVSKAARFLEPHRVTTFLQELAATFHHFYQNHRVVGTEADLTRARLQLVEGVRIVLANALRLLNVNAPERM